MNSGIFTFLRAYAPSARDPAPMQCTSIFRDPYEQAAWNLYLRESALRVAREEVAFLEATGGATGDEIVRIRERVMQGQIKTDECDEAMFNNNVRMLNTLNQSVATDAPLSDNGTGTVSLKSILVDSIQPDAVNQLCRKIRPLLERHGIFTCKKHQAVHVLQCDVQRVRDLSAGLGL